MKLTIETHDEYPESGQLELPAIDFNRSTSDRTKGMLEARLIHSPASAEKWVGDNDRTILLTNMLSELTRRLLLEDKKYGPVDYTLHVYLVGE